MDISTGISPDWAGGKKSIIVSGDFDGPEFLTPDQARRLGVRLIEAAHYLESQTKRSAK